MLLAIRSFELEATFGLVTLTPVVFFGFLLHAWLPVRAKLPAFLGLSFVALFAVLGAVHGALVIGLSLALIGLCHAPVSFGLRAAAVALAGALLAVLRGGWLDLPWARAVLPVVGAMFMFRTIVYLYDQRTEAKTGTPPASPWMRLAYFFLLPNVCFLLFPVVDYRTFRRTYYERPAHEIHQRGVEWMLRGVVHLLLYRIVYAYLVPATAEIQDLLGVVLYFVSSYLLYLRVSGHFHLIVGMLHLFGFHLPETNRRYLLASSFTDCWRRINVYWTEFMKKVVYYPTFVRLRRRGMLFGMVGATVATFVATWCLHAYQWFWLHGSFPLATDGLFWGLAGVLALVTMLWETKRGGASKLSGAAPTWSAAFRRSVQALGVFTLICTIWSVWCSTSFEQWLAIVSQAGHAPVAEVAGLLTALVGIVAVGTVAQRWVHARTAAPGAARGDGSPRAFYRRAAWTAGSALALLVLGHPPLRAALGPRAALAMEPIAAEQMNVRDRERLTASYYDRLVDREAFGSRVDEQLRVDADNPEHFQETALAELVGPPLLYELAPSKRATYLGVPVETNRWAMRDRDYTLAKPAGTFRIAVLGTCYEMGAGVRDEEVWERLAEAQLARELTPRTGLDYEILNFSVPGYTLLQLASVMRTKVPQFEPDVVLVSNHVRSTVKYLIYLAGLEQGRPEEFAEVFARTGVEPGQGEIAMRMSVGKQRAWIERWAFARIAASCTEIGAAPVLLEMPFVEALRGPLEPMFGERAEEQREFTRALGYRSLDLTAAFDGQAYEAISIHSLAHCPSAAGHRLMSARFCEALTALLALE